MLRILFVCLGNICRSPTAQALFEREVKRQKMEAWVVADSCGLESTHRGELPDKRAQKVAAMHGLELLHRAQYYRDMLLSDFSLIFVMDPSQKRYLDAYLQEFPSRVFLYKSFDDHDPGSTLQDPYFREEKAFHEVFAVAQRVSLSLVAYIAKADKFFDNLIKEV